MAHKNRNLPDTWRWGIHLIIGVLFMVGIVFFSSWRALRATEERFCQTLDFVKSQSTSFEKYNDTVVAKALRRAAVAVHQLAQDPALDFSDPQCLNKQVETLWLTGISVLAPDGTLLCESTTNGIGYARFGEQLKNDTVLDVFSYLQKTYLKRVLLEDGSAVDVAAYRAEDNDVILLAYRYTPAEFVEGTALSIQSVLDGNHSFATAKANWEKVKATLTPEEQADHPARFALVELENVHDDGIVFEPIHRVVFNVHVPAFLEALKAKLAEQNNGECEINFYDCECCMEKAEKAAPEGAHVIPVITENGKGLIAVAKPNAQLEVGTLQNALDVVLKATEGATIDYIHGADVVNELGSKHGNIGFLLPPMEKSAFFRTVVFDGALPRKTFSMGEAHEKRYYLECRKICK